MIKCVEVIDRKKYGKFKFTLMAEHICFPSLVWLRDYCFPRCTNLSVIFNPESPKFAIRLTYVVAKYVRPSARPYFPFQVEYSMVLIWKIMVYLIRVCS